MNIMLLIDTNITSDVYYHNQMGYNMVCYPAVTMSTDGAQGGVGLVVREWLQGWSVESTRFHGPNVVSCEVISGGKQNPLVRAYLLLSTLEHLPVI